MSINVQVGAPVQYNCDVTISPNQNTTHAAIVLGVSNDGTTVNLWVMPDSNQPGQEVQPFYMFAVPPQPAGVGALNFNWSPLTTNP